MQVPIISAYETVDSRVRTGMFKTTQMRIAPREHAVIGSPHEVVIAVPDLDHNNACNIPVWGDLYKAIQTAWQRALDDAPGLISKKFYASTRGDGDDKGTLRSITTVDELARMRVIPMPLEPVTASADHSQSAKSSTRDATYGSSIDPNQVIDRATTTFEVVKSDPKLPCFSIQVHKRMKDFFGRQDILDLIDESLLPDRQVTISSGAASVRSFALCGMGGIGKTQIAVEYAYSRRDKYDAIFLITADGKTMLSEQFARIASELRLEDPKNSKDLTVSSEIVRKWLSDPVRTYEKDSSADNRASWLLIFDNADDPSVLEEFWPNTGYGAVLITSRDSVAKNQPFTDNVGIDLKPFTSPDAVKFLTTLTHKTAQDSQAKDAAEVADRLGGLPLLINQMADSFKHELATAQLFGDAGWYRFERGFQEESKEWFALVQTICDGLEDRSSKEALYMIRDTHHNMGTAAGETNDVKTFLKNTAIWLEMLKQRTSPDGSAIIDYELAMGFNETGVAHAMDGQYEVALDYFSKAIDTYQKLPHYVETMLGWSASNIGLMYWVLGRLEEAETALVEIIEIFAAANGVDDILSFK
ncbi:tetratricopeptide repeat domain-containing protein [Colletotrichum sp. SAR11_239]|nr:tetratricopeptide repeat domain-containing protein [Colletotrichum sp. SAR11_239]